MCVGECFLGCVTQIGGLGEVGGGHTKVLPPWNDKGFGKIRAALLHCKEEEMLSRSASLPKNQQCTGEAHPTVQAVPLPGACLVQGQQWLTWNGLLGGLAGARGPL